MKSSMFSKAFAHHVLSVLLVASTILAPGTLAAAADANDQASKGRLHQKSARVVQDDNDGSNRWERNPRIDRFDGTSTYPGFSSCPQPLATHSRAQFVGRALIFLRVLRVAAPRLGATCGNGMVTQPTPSGPCSIHGPFVS
jgi:hypothetical protein